MSIRIIDDGTLANLDIQLVRSSNQKLDVPSPASSVCTDPRKENVLDILRLQKRLV